MFNILSYFFLVVMGAVVGIFAFIALMESGAPIHGLALFGCGALFTGGWFGLAMELTDV